jgi:hypothetical protein
MSPPSILGPSLVLGLAIASLGCESKSSTSTGPSPVKCQVSVEAPSNTIEAAGGKDAIAVTAPPECSWTASSDTTWLTGLTPSSGQGSGRVEFQAAANPAGTTRQGHIEVNGQQISVQQRPADCRFEVSPVAPTIDAAGGTVAIAVTTLAGCSWQASTDVGWVAITGAGGTGSGSVSLRVAPSGDEARSAALLVAGQTVRLTQSPQSSTTPTSPTSPNCVFSLDRASEAVSAAGGSVTVAVSVAAGCSRTASSQAPWITVVAGASGTGPGAVTFHVASNIGAARTGTLIIAGRVFTVTQAAAGANSTTCSYAIAPDNQSMGADGREGTPVTVSTAAGCEWNATSNAGWITLVSGATGNGAGVVRFRVADNTGPARTGTLTIAGRAFTVNQASGCTYSINPKDQKIGDKGGQVTVAVSAGAGCGWTATSNESWITITDGATGSGDGTVRLNVAPGKKRTGTLTIAGRTFKVEQD